MTNLLSLQDLIVTNHHTFNWHEVTDRVITGYYGIDFSVLIKKLEKGDL